MKIKKYIAPDIRRAIKMVRDDQGPDAVIISNRRVEGGVEIISAIDYDESLLSSIDSESKGSSKPLNDSQQPIIGDATYIDDDYSSILTNQEAHGRPSSQSSSQNSVVDEERFSEMREELKYLRNIVEKRFFDLEWSNYSHHNPIHADVLKKLVSCGVSSKLAQEIVKELPSTDKVEKVWEAALGKMGERLHLMNEDVVEKGGVIALVGPTGVGKTTTIAKLAARYALRRGVRHAALISTDNYRVGAHEQLRTYGRLLDIPLRNALNKEELQAHLDDLVDKDLVLIDTAGMSQRDLRISEQLSVLKESKTNIKVYLVLAATSQLSGLEETISVFRGINLDGCILTKLDEATSIGPALSAIIEQKLPLAYVSDGQRVPEDLHLARIDKLINSGTFDMNKGESDSIEELMRFSVGRMVSNAH